MRKQPLSCRRSLTERKHVVQDNIVFNTAYSVLCNVVYNIVTVGIPLLEAGKHCMAVMQHPTLSRSASDVTREIYR